MYNFSDNVSEKGMKNNFSRNKVNGSSYLCIVAKRSWSLLLEGNCILFATKWNDGAMLYLYLQKQRLCEGILMSLFGSWIYGKMLKRTIAELCWCREIWSVDMKNGLKYAGNTTPNLHLTIGQMEINKSVSQCFSETEFILLKQFRDNSFI